MDLATALFAVLGIAATGLLVLAVSHLYWWIRAPKVHMRCDSTGGTPGQVWTAAVWYDAWGTPYAKDHHGSDLRLFRDGKTADSWVYGTEWRHKSGPPVFSRDRDAAEGRDAKQARVR